MTNIEEKVLWGIHGGKTGDADSPFIRHKVVALDWHLMGDLSSLPKSRDAFKEKLAKTFPTKKPGATR